MTTAIEEFLANINKRISILENELERLQEVRKGVSEGRGLSPRPTALHPMESRQAA
jgi:hypothetical protein